MNDAPAHRRVVRVITRLNVGGPARQALLLSRLLGPDFPTTLVAGTPSAEEGELSDPEVPVRRVPMGRDIRPDADARAMMAVRRLLGETRARLVHTHMAKAGAVGRCAALTLRPRPRLVHTFHGHVLDGYFGAPVQRAFVEIERRLARSTDVLVAVSTQIRDGLLELGIGRPDQYRVIPLGIDLAPYLAVHGPSGALRRSLGIASEVPLVGVIGRLVPIKDNAVLLDALARLPGVHLAVLGDGSARRQLEQRTRQMGLGGRVHFTGWWADVAGALADVDVVALTSRNEGTPVSLIEAAAAGRPAVATRVGGVGYVVEHGMTGYLARPGDAEEIASLLRPLLADRHARLRMGLAAREHVRVRFGQERLVSDIRALYGDLCAEPLPR